MSKILYEQIPVVDLADFVDSESSRKQKFVQTLGQAFNHIGFVAVKNHGLSDQITQPLYKAVKDFFALPEATKLNYQLEGIGGQRGYTAKGKEHAKGRKVGDLKEFYHVGQSLAQDELRRLGYPANIFPQEVPEFEPTTIAAYRILETAGIQIL
ncbi:MAG: 2-oxoglutarate and iron-dependent oxygenase domain-containing protein, partial [Cyanobacteria bacterium P01_A01_bin.83]